MGIIKTVGVGVAGYVAGIATGMLAQPMISPCPPLTCPQAQPTAWQRKVLNNMSFDVSGCSTTSVNFYKSPYVGGPDLTVVTTRCIGQMVDWSALNLAIWYKADTSEISIDMYPMIYSNITITIAGESIVMTPGNMTSVKKPLTAFGLTASDITA